MEDEDEDPTTPSNKAPINTVKDLASKFQTQTPGGSKIYSRVTEDGTNVSVRKSSRAQSSPDSPGSEVEGSQDAKAKGTNVTQRQRAKKQQETKKPRK